MKKKLIFVLVCMLVFSTVLGTISSSKTSTKSLSEETTSRDFTHTVFAEDATATWCQYCKYAHAALKKIYASGDYPFYYTTLVCDKNPIAYTRADSDYNFAGYPTVFFDGGYKVNVGGGTGNEAQYRSSITSCGNRAVYDIDINLDATWLGGTEMEIDVSVDNNEASTYNGTIRVYITEIVSSMGWIDTGGYPYTFPFLDFAFNEVISISSGGTWSDSTTWDGSAHGYGSITEDNIMLIASVFNDDWHQGYAYPGQPDPHPFDAYYVDDAVGYRVGNNRPPNAPDIDGSTSGNAGTEYNYTFSAVDPDWFDNVFYYIDWGDDNIEEWIGPYSSGEEITISHAWSKKGTYTITAKAKDVFDAEGPEGTLEVIMPKNKAFNMNQLFLRFLDQHPNMFPILRHLLGL